MTTHDRSETVQPTDHEATETADCTCPHMWPLEHLGKHYLKCQVVTGIPTWIRKALETVLSSSEVAAHGQALAKALIDHMPAEMVRITSERDGWRETCAELSRQCNNLLSKHADAMVLASKALKERRHWEARCDDYRYVFHRIANYDAPALEWPDAEAFDEVQCIAREALDAYESTVEYY